MIEHVPGRVLCPLSQVAYASKKLDRGKVDELAVLYRDKKPIEDIAIRPNSGGVWSPVWLVVDGHHRVAAARKAKRFFIWGRLPECSAPSADRVYRESHGLKP